MSKEHSETRRIIYRSQHFIKSIHIDGRFWANRDGAPPDVFETITIEWTHKPIDAMHVSEGLAEWLTHRDYGLLVTLSITLDGMPDEEEPD